MTTRTKPNVVEWAQTVARETPVGNMLTNERRIVRLDAERAEELRQRFGRHGILTKYCNVGNYALQQRIVRSDLTEPLPWETFDVAPGHYLRMLCARATGLTSDRIGSMSDGIRAEAELGRAERDARDAVKAAERLHEAAKEAGRSAYAVALKAARIYGKAQRGEAPQDKVNAIRATLLAKHGPKVDEAWGAVLDARSVAADAVEAASFPRFCY